MHTKWSSSTALIVLVLFGGVYVITSYAYLLPKAIKPGATFDSLWFGIPATDRRLFYVSMALATIGFVVAFVRFVRDVQWKTFPSLCIPYAIFFTGAVLWTSSLWWWSFDTYTQLARGSVVLALCITTLGAALLLREAWVVRKDTVATIGTALLLMHVTLFDNLYWARAFWLKSGA